MSVVFFRNSHVYCYITCLSWHLNLHVWYHSDQWDVLYQFWSNYILFGYGGILKNVRKLIFSWKTFPGPKTKKRSTWWFQPEGQIGKHTKIGFLAYLLTIVNQGQLKYHYFTIFRSHHYPGQRRHLGLLPNLRMQGQGKHHLRVRLRWRQELPSRLHHVTPYQML